MRSHLFSNHEHVPIAATGSPRSSLPAEYLGMIDHSILPFLRNPPVFARLVKNTFLDKSINEGNGNHTSLNGRFELELNDGSVWILYSSNPELEFHYITAQPNEPNK